VKFGSLFRACDKAVERGLHRQHTTAWTLSLNDIFCLFLIFLINNILKTVWVF